MMDKTEKEIAALQSAVRNMAEVIGADMGFDVPPSHWTPEQITTLAEVAAETFLKEAGYLLGPQEMPF